MPTSTLSLPQLQRALAIAEQIQSLEEELNGVLGGAIGNGSPAPKATAPAPAKRGRKPFSTETKAKMAAAQKARWAAKKGPRAGANKAVAVAAPRAGKPGKRTMSPETKAKMAAAMKARWAAAKKKGLPGPNARK